MNKAIYAILLIAGIVFLIGGCEKQATSPETQPVAQEQTTFTGVKGGGLHQIQCCSGGIGNRVWFDENCNGIQDAGEIGMPLVVIRLLDSTGTLIVQFTSGWNGQWGWGVCQGKYIIEVVTPEGYTPSPTNAPGSTPADDSNVNPSVVVIGCDVDSTIDFGFCRTPPPPSGPCSRTPGYWKTHPRAWPVSSITIGGFTYTKAQAIYYMSQPDGDKRYTMFRHLVSAKLNLLTGTNGSCISTTIALADAWMATYAGSGLGSGPAVDASSEAWRVGEPYAMQLDAYNNGLLCAPHCDSVN